MRISGSLRGEKSSENALTRSTNGGRTPEYQMIGPLVFKLLLQTAMKTLGGLDYLMLNHALIPRVSFWNSTSEDLKMLSYTTDTNFLSYVHLTSYAMPYLVKSKGHIGVMASIAGRLY